MKEAAWEVKTLWTETVMPRDALCTAFTAEQIGQRWAKGRGWVENLSKREVLNPGDLVCHSPQWLKSWIYFELFYIWNNLDVKNRLEQLVFLCSSWQLYLEQNNASCYEAFSSSIQSSKYLWSLPQVSETCSFSLNVEQTVVHNCLQIAIRWMLITVNKNWKIIQRELESN